MPELVKPNDVLRSQIFGLEMQTLRVMREALIGIGTPGAAIQSLKNIDAQIAALRAQLT